MASHLHNHMDASLSQVVRRASDDEFSPLDYTSTNGHVCDMPRPMLNTETTVLAGGYDFYTTSKIITGACACFTIISLLILMFQHATHLSRPNEQLSIMRICCYLPILAIGCFLEVAYPNAYVYINPWLDVAQAMALCSFFIMMCQFVSPSDSQRDAFFRALKLPEKKSRRGVLGKVKSMTRRGNYGRQGEHDTPVNGLLWYRKMWISIFQYPVVQALIAVFTAITESQGVYCMVSSKTYFAHLWLDIIHNISLTLAVMSCLRLLSGLKGQLKHHRPLLKLAAFKLLIAVTFIIQIVYWILRSINSPLKPTTTLSWADDFIGIPVLCLSLFTVPFSILFHFAYDVQTYYLENVDRNIPLARREDLETCSGNSGAGLMSIGLSSAGSSYQGGFLGIRAWLGMLNPSELISGFVFGLTMLSSGNREAGITVVRRAQTGEFSGA